MRSDTLRIGRHGIPDLEDPSPHTKPETQLHNGIPAIGDLVVTHPEFIALKAGHVKLKINTPPVSSRSETSDPAWQRRDAEMSHQAFSVSR